MSSIKALARLLKELEDQLAVCMRCGLCQSVCPLFAETGREADVARGKLALLSGLARELFAHPQGVMARLQHCLLCGSCAANCPGGVKVLDIFIQARAILTGYMGLSPAKKLIFRGLLARPELFNTILGWGAKFQGIFLKPVDDLLGSSCSRFLSPLLQDRHLKALAPAPFHRLAGAQDIPAGASGLRVAFFVGCLIDKVFPRVGDAVITALSHHGVGLYFPADQGCCGIPALSGGDTVTFEKLVRHNLALFGAGDFDWLVTACATCTATLKQMWPLMAQDLTAEEQDRIAALAAKAMDVNAFLAEKVEVRVLAGPEADGIPLTYHDPCHLKKSLGVAAQPRALLAANPRYRLTEMAEADVCCGCGGSFNLQYYEVSRAIGRRKRDNIARSGAQVLATGCPACMLQLTDLLSQAGDKVQVKHAVEIYAEILKAAP